MTTVRAILIVSGAVQRAGYRDFVGEMAYNLKLKGYAKNLKDETVEIVCEGEKSAIEKFAQMIKIQQYPISVETVCVKFSKPTGEFKHFNIILGNIQEEICDRIDMWIYAMRGISLSAETTALQ